MTRFDVHQGGGTGGSKDKDAGPITLFERLADHLSYTGRATTVFGEAIERDGVTVIPVAKAKWALGGGGGHRRPGNQEGMGGGGAVNVAPVGYIEIRNGESRFRPIWDPVTTFAASVAAGAALVFLLSRLRGKDEEE
ncbi:MAG TPA: spore germination protein GerW family protein [Thermoanaerobaculia bacterium]|nr:spore germination protein GerW family protein [Thermoanaerobaculia bacterium]